MKKNSSYFYHCVHHLLNEIKIANLLQIIDQAYINVQNDVHSRAKFHIFSSYIFQWRAWNGQIQLSPQQTIRLNLAKCLF